MYRTVALPHVVRLPVLGVPVRFMTNDPDVLEAVLESFGMWANLTSHPGLVSADELRVRLVVHEGTEGSADRTPVRYRMPDSDRVIVHTPGSVGIVDAARRDAVAYVTRPLVDDRGHLQYGILEMLTLVLVTVRDRLPLHGAMIVRDGNAIVLAAPSGIGKSTLAYQARRTGWTLLADDSVYVQSTPRMRIGGGPRRLFLPPDAARWFPELAPREPRMQANGKTKIAVPHHHDWQRLGPPVVEAAAICVLTRAAGPARLERIEAAPLRAALLADLAGSQDLYGDAPDHLVTRMSAHGGWRLTLSANPADAVPLLEELAGQISGESSAP